MRYTYIKAKITAKYGFDASDINIIEEYLICIQKTTLFIF